MAALDQFRQLFPAALCYTKIVPVDEVVTLTLYYREDDQFRRLLLDDAQTAELERLWAGLHFVSHSPLKLVDAFEQLWQYATQDADPSAFCVRIAMKMSAAASRWSRLACPAMTRSTASRVHPLRAITRLTWVASLQSTTST